ncbi:helix-turn-helix domain-containing protein [Neisseria sp. Dent CA1/247]|uniref:LexA family transcriptional regulator n=1 Tax=Neisseria sp. Dent CA1/247 TaxID=2912675 RepID=UPI001FD47840|nr:LexA family transcriptional regulator [Neisseria sp. Dent CA1/247]UOO76490.1 helix-turn-helix domain-containing protein [Neisseria sp. Dent CA1/247]
MHYDLAKWVVNARKRANLTQEELAEAIGFSGKASISALEKGRNKPTFDVMVKISEVCNYPLPFQNQIINNNAAHIQVGGNNFGDASYSNISGSSSVPINLENVPDLDFLQPFLARVSNDDLCSEGIFKNDVLTINPNITARHGNFILVLSKYGRGFVAKLFIDIKNQHFLKYNENNPEIIPSDAQIIGVVTNLNRSYT